MFLIVLSGVHTRLEETGHLDERTFFQEIQLGASLLGAHLNILEGTDLLLVAVLILLGGADCKRELPLVLFLTLASTATIPVTVKLLLVAITFYF